MNERSALVTFKGDPLTLIGNEVKVGDAAPDFTGLTNDLSEVALVGFRGKVLVMVSVPSLDTPVCETEVRRFNEEAGRLGDEVQVLVISMDLPFAQKRWCAAGGIQNVQTLSDHREGSFGSGYGVLIGELRLLARSVWVVDRDGKVRYAELVKELTDEPDYDAALAAARGLLEQ